MNVKDNNSSFFKQSKHFSWIENFLTSGHHFEEDEYEIKSKFFLLNSMLFVTWFSILSLTVLLFLDHKIKFALVNCIYLLFGIVAIFYLRRRKENSKIIIYLIPIISIPLVVTAITYYPTEQIRIAWFLVIIMASFFLGGKKLGIIVSIASILVIVVLYLTSKMILTKYLLMLSFVILVLGTIIVYLYENRQNIAKKRLHVLNTALEQRVKKEIKKRILIYEKANTELAQSADKLQKQKNAYKELAHYDTLTGLPNRVLFYDRLKHALAKSRREECSMALLFLDLDNFKEINDSLGHHIGDKVLQVVSERLKKKIRESDTLARLGGDEFILLFEKISETSKLGELAHNLIETVSEPVLVQGYELYITMSVGISIYPDDGDDPDTLLKCADAAMYSAKKDGCNLVHFYEEEMTLKSLERLILESSLRQALEKDEFVVYYQPIIDIATDKLLGLEALVRWRHPERGLLTPYHFIDVAESSSIIVQLGEHVLRKVAVQLKDWHEGGFDPGFIAVNISVKQLRHQNFLSLLSEILKQTAFRTTHWLELEVTEGYMMQKPLEAIKLLHEIRNLGITIAVDDFGTGYSSLSYLKKLPVNKLKIDRSFVKDIVENSDDKALVSAIVSMAHSMDLEVVAEGVETVVQKDLLYKIGCTMMQGYYFSKPEPANELDQAYLSKYI